jgi:hypothetical protein
VYGFAYTPASLLGRTIPSVRVTALLRHPIAHSGLRWYRNVNLLSIDYAFRPRLRSRLTLSGRTFLRNPWVFGGLDSHQSFRYSYRHSHLYALHGSLRYRFDVHTTLPYHNRTLFCIHSFGGVFSPVTFSAQSHSTSELLRTLSMVAASKPTSWLSKQLHILSHLTHTWGP